MEQDKLAELIKLIMADNRILELIRNGTDEFPGASRSCDLALIETRDRYQALPLGGRQNVFCQELREGDGGFLSYDAALRRQWSRIRIYQPSLNFIAKLALGIADEPMPAMVQQKLAEGAGNIELCGLCKLAEIKGEAYRKLFLDHVDKLRSYGINVCGDELTEGTGVSVKVANGAKPVNGARPMNGAKTMKGVKVANGATTLDAANAVNAADAVCWQYKALTERDIFDMEKNSVVVVGRKCIVTSLAADMARRKSIRICREGEVK